MKILNGKEYYTTVEISEILKVNIGMIYYRINNKSDFPKATLINNLQHWSEDQIEEIRHITSKKLKRGRSRQVKYTPHQHNSYSKLKVENLELIKQIESLEEKLKEGI